MSEKTNKDDSITNVHFSERGAYKYISGQRDPISIRIDRGLYKHFKPLAKRVYGSVCRAIEVYITTLIETVENGVHISNTEKPIKIDKIVIERNLRSRRKLELKGDNDQICGFKGCNKKAVARGVYHHSAGLKECEEFLLCDKHLLEAEKQNSAWSDLQEL